MNPNTKPRAVLYLRQSVAREESISIELQEEAGRRYAKQRGYDVVAVKSDRGISGRTWNRDAVKEVMAMIENSQADVIVLWKWSRLSRARLDWAIALDRVESAGGRIESATEQVDISTSTGRFARGMLAEMAVFESERIGDTWKEAHARRIAQGLPHGGHPRFGYTYDHTTGYTPDPEQVPYIKECYRRFLAGASIRDLCAYLNSTTLTPPKAHKEGTTGLWGVRTVRDMMDNPFMIGKIKTRGTLIPGAHEPIIDTETWEAYTVARQQRRRSPSTQKRSYTFSGLLRCSICGHGMSAGYAQRDNVNRYRCNGASNHRLHKGGYINEPQVEEAVLKWLTEIATELESSAKQHRVTLPKHDPTPQLRRALIKVDARLDALTTKLLDDLIPNDVYVRMRDKLAAEKEQIEGQLLQANVGSRAVPKVITPQLLKLWPAMSGQEKNALLKTVLKGIVVTSQKPRSLVQVIARWDDEDLPEQSITKG